MLPTIVMRDQLQYVLSEQLGDQTRDEPPANLTQTPTHKLHADNGHHELKDDLPVAHHY